MPAGLQTQILIVCIILIVYANYSSKSLSHKIHCTFRRADRTRLKKWATESQARIEFDGGWYQVEPARTTLELWSAGIHFLFPTWIRTLDYRYDSARALHPDTFENTYTPEARKQLDMTDDVRAMSEGHRQALSGKAKVGRLTELMPIIMILGFAAVGFVVYTMLGKIDGLGQAVNVLQSMMMKK
jgi:hypothetical protein